MDFAVYNPHNKPLEELPYILGFNNGGQPGLMMAVAIAQDGRVLGSQACSHEGFMPFDLGVVTDHRRDRHENQYQKHYPDGYRMDWVPHDQVKADPRVMEAFRLNQLIPEEKSDDETVA